MIGKLRKSSVRTWYSDFLRTLTSASAAASLLAAARPGALSVRLDVVGGGRTVRR
jgi:hypothetical protein